MHTPPPASSPSPDGEGVSYEDAKEAVDAVIAWYGRQLLDARRSGDQQRQAELIEQMQACAEDRRRLIDAAPAEMARINDLYAERLRNLGTGGS
ncbi:hypothetical protein [Streptomyces sp. NRRL B-24484]|uniref:hypothetical protein n=1 Tax=Streptomyces sp. NRRL B-24484 TaxID=1463833 RepID=UPI0004C27459|nr:hypothetical protein [Streptomyces sp. NRRL B-24484]